jgi:hypothetical protein
MSEAQQKQKAQAQAPAPLPLNSLVVLSLYAIAVLTVFFYSSNMILFLVYAGTIGASAYFLQPQMAIYMVSGVVVISVFLQNLLSQTVTAVESTVESVV